MFTKYERLCLFHSFCWKPRDILFTHYGKILWRGPDSIHTCWVLFPAMWDDILLVCIATSHNISHVFFVQVSHEGSLLCVEGRQWDHCQVCISLIPRPNPLERVGPGNETRCGYGLPIPNLIPIPHANGMEWKARGREPGVSHHKRVSCVWSYGTWESARKVEFLVPWISLGVWLGLGYSTGLNCFQNISGMFLWHYMPYFIELLEWRY